MPCKTAAMVAGVCLVTGGYSVQAPAMSVPVVVSLGKALHPPCLLMVVRGLGGACVWQPHFCQSAPGQLWLQYSLPLSVCDGVFLNGWMPQCSVKRFGVSGNLIKGYSTTGHLPFIIFIL
ncbi:hypothetical protein AMECASPLE_025026 [Ameca splendens]|uniref:Secreted protein n=1 Tax=Ameca splendens TaxID=208324 RepID=A0ABV0ZFF3_9TELE